MVNAFAAEGYVLAIPFERVAALVPDLPIDLSRFTHSPITGIHLWFDRAITNLPHATLLDRTIQWMFNKHEGRHIQLVVSASRSLVEMRREEVIDLALRELKEFFPQAAEAQLERAHVVKEVRATFSAAPNLEDPSPVQCNLHSQSVSGRGLDAFRLAGNDGRRGTERLPGSGSGAGFVGREETVLTARCCVGAV